MTSHEIRKSFLDFFKSKGHTIVPSDSLVPTGDPTVLFTGAGMNQFKEKFLGRNLTFTKAASCQKCLRTGDLEKVGKTRGHHTFFEMLGNFSFGDYFKEEAIKFAWEYICEELRLDKDKLWVTVYEKDSESYDIWKNAIGLDDSKIQKKGTDENFWPPNAELLGPNGPCGPCSEIYFNDLEVWNLVFTQFDRVGENKLENLKNKNIDTGMGLERITQVVENVGNNFETDQFADIIKKIQPAIKISGDESIMRRNAVADHIRAITFAISDGVLPSNELRGYVIRKLIRRSVVHLMHLGVKDAFLYKLVDTVARAMREPYPELEKTRDTIAEIVKKEEAQFSQLFSEKMPLVEDAFLNIARDKSVDSQMRTKKIIDIAFEFYDTHGVPLEMLEDRAAKAGLVIPEEEFEKRLQSQREKSRMAGKTSGEIFSLSLGSNIEGLGFKTEFVGYKKSSQDAKIIALLDLTSGKEITSAKKNELIGVVLDRTPFYGESGGQVGDTGVLEYGAKKIKVIDTKRFQDTIVHIAKFDADIAKGLRVIATIDDKRRVNIMSNHTATHLLQSVLRDVLGTHIRQSGSLVDDKHFRFDFVHPSKIEERELEKISARINELIMKNDSVSIKDNVKIDDAKKDGAMAIFGEKYADSVRVVSISSYSKELCGGTHLASLKDIGYFKIISESSISSGVRRIEALTGKTAKDFIIDSLRKALSGYSEGLREINALEAELGLKKTEPQLASKYNATRFEKYGFKDLKKVEDIILELKYAQDALAELKKDLAKKISQTKLKGVKSSLDNALNNAIIIGPYKILIHRIDGTEINMLRSISDELKSKLNSSCAVLLGGNLDDKPVFVLNLSEDLVKKGLNAVNIIKSVSSIVEGSGGGRPGFAQAGGKSSEKLDLSLKEALSIIEKEIKK